MQNRRRKSCGGFTLVELLLAVGLTAVVAALAYAGVSRGVQASTALETEVAALTELQRAFDVMETDLTQARQRPLLLGLGYREPAFASGVDSGVLLTFTRGGAMPAPQALRSELLRVRYVARDGALWRQHWPQLDRSEVQQRPHETMLLASVDEVRVEFLEPPSATAPLSLTVLQAGGGPWQTQWDSEAPARALTSPLPLAVRVTLTTARFGQVQRVFELQ
ncbi:MAG TPA: type II secretion system minor pseudopilin GspJ [Candidatus Acidoferrum sp.]|nr:type II secretion system minor pseudopilin GspJ [Candidatus Acidoferrum sp.]